MLMVGLAGIFTGVLPAWSNVPDSIGYRAGLTAWQSSGAFAPHYLAANRFGTLTMGDGATLSLMVGKEALSAERKCDYSFGIEAIAGYRSKVAYMRYSPQDITWVSDPARPDAVRLQQLYAEVKWRSLFASVGMKERGSVLLDDNLSSGDLVHSANTRPIPQLRVGFIDFVDIPLTRGFLQIEGSVAYGRFADDGWWKSHFNHYNGHIASGVWYLYRRIYFRTSPVHRLRVTFGAQCVSQFGGTTDYYRHGGIDRVQHRGLRFGDFFRVFFPTEAGKEDFRIGNTLGSWDLKASYRLSGDADLSAYFQWPWEDGSGMAKRNGWDGLYGVEFHGRNTGNVITGLAIEYLDFTNQSGPMHWAPGDFPGTSVTGEARGADNYYNNSYYNSYAYFGQTIGSPMVMGPVYNRDGYMQMVGNRMKGVHAAVSGCLGSRWQWRLLCGWRKAYGNGFEPLIPALHAVSVMAESRWTPRTIEGLTIAVQAALDKGSLPSNSFGMAVSALYKGKIFGR